MLSILPALTAAVTRRRVTATFLVTSPGHTRVRADLYSAGVEFSDDRVAMFDWSFTVRASPSAWRRFALYCREPLRQLQVAGV